MIDRDADKVLIFIHIPKTAGSTLQQVVYNNHSDCEICILGRPSADDIAQGRGFGEVHRNHLQFIKSGSLDQKSRLKVLFGHMEFGLHRYFPNGAQYATVLRHPVSRIVSHYNFVRRSPAHYLHDKVVGEGISVADYIEGTRSKELNNGQVRILFGEEHKRIPFGECSSEHLDRAMENLENHFVFVGIQEKFRQSTEALARIMNWSVPEIKNRNVSDNSEKEPITRETSERFLLHNELDMLLYRKVLSQLEKSLAAR